MPARDIVHTAIKNALIKDGWLITDDPLIIHFGNEPIYIDFGAEKNDCSRKKLDRKLPLRSRAFLAHYLLQISTWQSVNI